jgi:hypothetical protein
MSTTYCVQADVESIIGAAAVLACSDDDQDGALSPDEDLIVTAAIERAATEMNSALCSQYKLSDLSGNDWCKWCNAYLACWYLFKRRANPGPVSIGEDIAFYRDQLSEARWGRFQIPEQNPSFEHTPAVSNFRPNISSRDNPIEVDTNTSTGIAPVGGRKRNTSDSWGTIF